MNQNYIIRQTMTADLLVALLENDGHQFEKTGKHISFIMDIKLPSAGDQFYSQEFKAKVNTSFGSVIDDGKRIIARQHFILDSFFKTEASALAEVLAQILGCRFLGTKMNEHGYDVELYESKDGKATVYCNQNLISLNLFE